MLFNSLEFLVFFLPVTLVGFFLLGRMIVPKAALVWLVTMSAVFYAWWSVHYLLLAVMLVANYGFGLWLQQPGRPVRRGVLAAGIVLNLRERNEGRINCSRSPPSVPKLVGPFEAVG